MFRLLSLRGAPPGCRQAVEDMAPQMGMSVGDAGVIEIAALDAMHADPLHYRGRSDVVVHGEGNDLIEAELSEAIGQQCPRRFVTSPLPHCRATSRQPISIVPAGTNGSR